LETLKIERINMDKRFLKNFNENNLKKNTNTIGDFSFQGDVIIFNEELPIEFNSFNEIKDGFLAIGESTFHAHVLFGDFELRENPVTKERHLRVVKPTLLKHQEHCPIEIQPGSYRIGIVREFEHTSEEISRVAD